ncbi:hypothetical protein P6B95_25140 [Streptomyces atratus]|uniref:hypothetical protein n=1 Tax=Streptomyces atratus TaxID=1893 RepID=UPI00167071D7|nr:hypothetical protein [Streptomyces atratus]WPW30335.1 hypothetical protein P6B95_25140 [Streptomyces atratus]
MPDSHPDCSTPRSRRHGHRRRGAVHAGGRPAPTPGSRTASAAPRPSGGYHLAFAVGTGLLMAAFVIAFAVLRRPEREPDA